MNGDTPSIKSKRSAYKLRQLYSSEDFLVLLKDKIQNSCQFLTAVLVLNFDNMSKKSIGSFYIILWLLSDHYCAIAMNQHGYFVFSFG